MLKKFVFAVVGLTLLTTPLLASAQITLPQLPANPTIADLQLEIQLLTGILTQLLATLRPVTPPQSTDSGLSALPRAGLAPLSVNFTLQGSFSQYSIDFGDGQSASGAVTNGSCSSSGSCVVSHTYTSTGSFKAILRRTPGPTEANCLGNDCWVVGRVTITVLDSSASANRFSASPTSGTAPLSVTFSTNQTIGVIDFGDGGSSSVQGVCTSSYPSTCSGTASHTYTSFGTYTARLSGQSLTISVLGTPLACPVYQQPMCSEHAHLVGGSQLSNGCYGAPHCVDDSSSSSPVITYVSNSGGTVNATYANLPTNSRVVLVNQTSGATVSGFTTTVTGSGNVTFSGIPTGSFYLKATDSSGTYLAQSVVFTSSGAATSLSFSAVLSTTPLQAIFTAQNSQVNSMMIDFGDSTHSDVSVCGGTPCSVNWSSSHTYVSPGTYTAKLSRVPGATEANCVGVDCWVLATATVTVDRTPYVCPVYQQPLCPSGQHNVNSGNTTDARGCQVPHNSCVADTSLASCTAPPDGHVYPNGQTASYEDWCARGSGSVFCGSGTKICQNGTWSGY